MRFDRSVVGVENQDPAIPRSFGLSQNYPNPFNPVTTISYRIATTSQVSLAVLDLLGREIEVIESGKRVPGAYEVTFDGSGLPSGIYLYRLEAGDFVETKSLVLLR